MDTSSFWLYPAIVIWDWLMMIFGIEPVPTPDRLVLGCIALLFWISVFNVVIVIVKRVLGFGSSEKRR